jgi:hypothetical protein
MKCNFDGLVLKNSRAACAGASEITMVIGWVVLFIF